jgi:hypothetical protein
MNPQTIKAFAIYDAKVKNYTKPEFFMTTEQAIRAFANSCKQEGSSLGMNPEDYSYWELGSYDQEKGTLASLTAPTQIARATDHVQTP